MEKINITRRTLLALDTAIVAIAASSFAQYPLVNAQANRVLNLYSARHYDADNTLYQGFTNRTGIRVNLVEAPADKLIERIKTSKNRDAAIKFLEYLASPEAQAIFAKGNNEYPVRANVAIDPKLASLGKFKEDRINVTMFGRNNKQAVRIMDRAGWK